MFLPGRQSLLRKRKPLIWESSTDSYIFFKLTMFLAAASPKHALR